MTEADKAFWNHIATFAFDNNYTIAEAICADAHHTNLTLIDRVPYQTAWGLSENAIDVITGIINGIYPDFFVIETDEAKAQERANREARRMAKKNGSRT
jgi:hypothetical protein